MPRDEFVSGLRNPCETRDVIVAPCQPFARRTISQRAIHGFSGKEGFAIRLDERNRALELVDWNFGKPRGCFLIGGVIHFARGDFAPTFDPPLAKKTLAIPNHERSWRMVPCPCAFQCLFPMRCSASLVFRQPEPRRCAGPDFFQTRASDNPTS